MPDRLVAEINRQGVHSLEVPDSFETDGSFVVELRNRGEPTHVHLHLDDSLSSVASLDAGNHYVQADSTRPVRVRVAEDRAVEGGVRGKLKVVTGYGAHTRYVDVTVETGSGEPVDVDPELSKPRTQSAGGRSSGGTSLTAPETLPTLVLGAVAVILAVGAVVAADGINIILGVLAVLAALLAAGYGALR